MVPGNGIIVKADEQAASGASVADYHLGGYRTREVTQPSSWTVTETKVQRLLLPSWMPVLPCASSPVLAIAPICGDELT